MTIYFSSALFLFVISELYDIFGFFRLQQVVLLALGYVFFVCVSGGCYEVFITGVFCLPVVFATGFFLSGGR